MKFKMRWLVDENELHRGYEVQNEMVSG